MNRPNKRAARFGAAYQPQLKTTWLTLDTTQLQAALRRMVQAFKQLGQGASR